jgi:hypothetical protein
MVTWGSWNKSKDTSTTQPIKRRGRKEKGRSSRTYQNKLRKLKSFYERTFRHSQEFKKSNINPKKTNYFCDRFPNWEAFLKLNPLKQATKRRS